MFKKKPTFLQRLDAPLFLATVALCVLGLVMVYSATLSTGSTNLLRSQFIATVIGFVFVFILLQFHYRVWLRLAHIIYLIANGLLVVTLLFGHGLDEWGARSWFEIGGFVFQPSEFVKIAFIICMADYMERHRDNINEPRVLLRLIAYAAVPIVLIALQPDFGTAMVFVVLFLIMLFMTGLSWRIILPILGFGLLSLPLLGPLAWKKLDTYQKNRILDWIDPDRATSSTGYQFNEGRIAIGNGQLWGKGLFRGTQTQYDYIPAKHNDYIFTVLVEELGFVGGALLLGLYAIVFHRMYRIADECRDLAPRLMITGFAALFIIHIWENIGMTMGLMPITGIPLPFMSHGGTFQMANLICIGLTLSIAKYQRSSHY